MYQSLVNSQIYLCIHASGYEPNMVYNLQIKAIKLMTASKYNAPTIPIFK